MRCRRRPVLSLALFAAVAMAGAVRAQTPPVDPACVAGEKAAAQQQASDSALFKQAALNFNTGGFPALEKELPVLEGILDRAPPNRPTKTCDGANIIYVGSLGETLVGLLEAAGKGGSGGKTVALPRGPYPDAAFLIGSYDVENGRYEAALGYLNRGLALAPTDAGLTTETANTLSHLGRSEEALAIVDRTLAGAPSLEPIQRARLLRSRGFSLGELKRYDEAEAAYRESLKLQPGHVGAQNELIYLARMKAGARSTPAILMTGDKSATTSADDVLKQRAK